MKQQTLLGYHFVGDTLRDGRPVPKNGRWLKHVGPVVPCESGLHMSVEPFDALQLAPGNTLCRVELRGDLQEHDGNKWVGRERKIIARIDATTLLRRFACDCALSVAHLWDMPAVVREYLETMDESKRAAAGAARAAWDAWAARAAARDARDAWAARAAARAAGAAARAAGATAADAQRKDFNARVVKAFEEAGK